MKQSGPKSDDRDQKHRVELQWNECCHLHHLRSYSTVQSTVHSTAFIPPVDSQKLVNKCCQIIAENCNI